MKIICQNCNKKGSCKITTGSIIEHIYSRLQDKKIVCWLETRCDKCRYLVDSWEAPEDYQPEITKTHAIKKEDFYKSENQNGGQ